MNQEKKLNKTELQERMTLQKDMERLTNKNQLMSRIKSEFDDELMNKFISHNNLNKDFVLDCLAHLVLMKRAYPSTLFGVLYHHYNDVNETAKQLDKMIDCELIIWNEPTGQFITKFNLSQDVLTELSIFQYPMPLIVPPKKIKNNRNNGYWYWSKGSIILKNNHTEDDICLDHINRMNRIALCINDRTASMVKNQWRNIDHKKPGETFSEYQERLKQFNKFNNDSKMVKDIILKTGNRFWLTWKYDKRGRCYSQGYHINPQGTDYCKAIIEFADKEYVHQ